MAIAFVKCTKIIGTGGTAFTTVSATAGNQLIAAVSAFQPVGTLSVTGGGTWAAPHVVGAVVSQMHTAFVSCLNATGGSATVTVLYSTSIGATTAFIFEFSGLNTTTIYEGAGTQNSGTSTTKATNALTNTAADAVKVAITSVDSGTTAAWTSTGTGWTLPANGEEDDSANMPGACAYKIVSASQSDTESWTRTGSDPFVANLATFLAAAGGGGPQDTPELYGRPDGLRGQNLMSQLLAQ